MISAEILEQSHSAESGYVFLEGLSDASCSAAWAARLFEMGDYATVAMKGGRGDWRTHAALGLIGKAEEALAGLAEQSCSEAKFYSAVTRWMAGDGERAAHILQSIATPHAQRLLALIRKPRIEVLAQLPWQKGSCSDLLTGMEQDTAFHVRNISFRPGDLPNEPYADIHSFQDASAPPDFYLCNMVEWHLVPPGLQQLRCPIFGQTGDYDLHIQTVLPWLQLFDEIIVTDPSEWRDVTEITRLPVASFPKSFRVPDGLPPIPQGPRALDFYLSGTILHAYHPDKARLVHRVLCRPDLRCKVVNGFSDPGIHYGHLANSKACLSYVRHPTALPTRGLEALAMGCSLLVQKDSVLTLFVGEHEGVASYGSEEELVAALGRIIARWPEHEQRARRGARLVRSEFAAARVGSQYLRFLTFLAAKPRPPRRIRQGDQLIQKRPIVEKGWLPCRQFEGSRILQQIAARNQAALQAEIERGPVSSRLFIDLTRESVLFNYHLARSKRIPQGEWVKSLQDTYRRGIEQCPHSLVLRFNLIRTMLHFGTPEAVVATRELLSESLALPASHWKVDLLEDVFSWDFFSEFFNYRAYFDLITASLKTGANVEADLVRLLQASLHFYRGLCAPYNGFHREGLDDFRQAALHDPGFPFYKLHYVDGLVARGLARDVPVIFSLLTELLDGSVVFLEALELLEQNYCLPEPEWALDLEAGPLKCRPDKTEGQGDLGRAAVPPEVARLARLAAHARKSIEFKDRGIVEPLQPDLRQAQQEEQKIAAQLRQVAQRLAGQLQEAQDRDRWLSARLEKTCEEAWILRSQIRAMESSNFWKAREMWLRIKKSLPFAKNQL